VCVSCLSKPHCQLILSGFLEPPGNMLVKSIGEMLIYVKQKASITCVTRGFCVDLDA